MVMTHLTGRSRRGCYAIPRTVRVIRVIDDPADRDRVIVTDSRGNRANMTTTSYHATCVLASGAQVDSLRILLA